MPNKVFTSLLGKRAKFVLRLSRTGFTLIEILVSISIITIVFGIIITSAQRIQKNARDQQRLSDLRNVQAALTQYLADHDNFPVALTFNSSPLKSLDGTKTYLNKLPNDPLTGNINYSYSPYPLECVNDPLDITTLCTNYCLYAKLEITPSPPPAGNCTANPLYNIIITQP